MLDPITNSKTSYQTKAQKVIRLMKLALGDDLEQYTDHACKDVAVQTENSVFLNDQTVNMTCDVKESTPFVERLEEEKDVEEIVKMLVDTASEEQPESTQEHTPEVQPNDETEPTKNESLNQEKAPVGESEEGKDSAEDHGREEEQPMETSEKEDLARNSPNLFAECNGSTTNVEDAEKTNIIPETLENVLEEENAGAKANLADSQVSETVIPISSNPEEIIPSNLSVESDETYCSKAENYNADTKPDVDVEKRDNLDDDFVISSNDSVSAAMVAPEEELSDVSSLASTCVFSLDDQETADSDDDIGDDALDEKTEESNAAEIKRLVLMTSSSSSGSELSDSEVSSCNMEMDKEDQNNDESVESDKENKSQDQEDKKTLKGEETEEKEKNIDAKTGNKTETDEIKNEEREIRRLTDLSNLSKTRALKSESDGSTNADVEPKKKSSKKKEEESETFEEFLKKCCEEESENSSLQSSGDEMIFKTDTEKRFLEMNNQMLKQVILASSSDSSDSSSSGDNLFSRVKKPTKKTIKSEVTPTKRPSWMNDKLLRSEPLELSTSEEEARWKKKRDKELERRKSEEVQVVSSDTDTDFILEVPSKKVKAEPKVSPKPASSWSSTSSSDEVEHLHSVKSEDTPGKGRKNIKKLLKKESLHVETKQAQKLETERKKRIAERQRMMEELVHVEGDIKKLILDFDPETMEPIVTVHKHLTKKLKPHQRLGVKFMWDNCFESVKRLEEDSGSGCILAHCMGLGKTLQVVTLVHTLLTHNTGVKTVLVVCPLNTVSNWQHEFRFWLEKISTKVELYDITKYKKVYERSHQLSNWKNNGGVFVLSYDMFRKLTTGKSPSKQRFAEVFEETLVSPGPDLVICDEGHLLKNEGTNLSKCMSRIKSLRRIVLTGTPLQNNLAEYHCMVQFIKPNILGNKQEFANRFVNPIANGQFEDSTDADVRLMKRRSHVLHKMLDGCIQRFDYSVLTPYLPTKHEYVLSIALTASQACAYKYYLTNRSAIATGSSTAGHKLFKDYQCLQRVYTHPFSLALYSNKKLKKKAPGTEDKTVVLVDEEDRNWWRTFFDETQQGDIRESGKLVLLFSILKECKAFNDKLLVFSQSLYSLGLIENFLRKINEATSPDPRLGGHHDTWELGRDYFRLDGTTQSEQRTEWCKSFNNPENNRARLFLISTRAGGLGINLIAANRVVVFDASWNPSHDVQSIFRVYRFGQTKQCYIYRFLCEATMEEKIYGRQVAKLSLARRVVDELQIRRHYTMRTLQELYTFEPTPPEMRVTPLVPKDTLLAMLLRTHAEWVVSVHEHDSLLENAQDEELTEEERRAAWDDFEKDSAKAVEERQLQNAALAARFNNSEVLSSLERYRNPIPSTSARPYPNDINFAPASRVSSPIFHPNLAQRLQFGEMHPNPAFKQLVSQPRNLQHINPIHRRRTHQMPNVPQQPVWTVQGGRSKYSEKVVLEIAKDYGMEPNEGETLSSFWARVREAVQQPSIYPNK